MLGEATFLPLSSASVRRKIDAFLAENGLRTAPMDCFAAILDDEDDTIVAGGGLDGSVIKCVAVGGAARSGGAANRLMSALISEAQRRGHSSVQLFTKPSNEEIFRSLGFKTLASAPEAVLMETGDGLAKYLKYLSGLRRPGRNGIIVMNANPFTLGHEYLVRKAAEGVDNLYVIPVREDRSRFPYEERLAMIRAGASSAGGSVTVAEGSPYTISAATFPTYFLKDLSEASPTQMALDLDLFCRHIAPALGAQVRFAGSEPASDPLTARYNSAMRRILGRHGIVFTEIPRLKGPNGRFIKASRVRDLLDRGRFRDAAALTPASTRPYLLADLAAGALRTELDAPLKPGLVCPGSNGAHSDMDYALMQKSIAAIRPFFPAMVLAEGPEALRQTGLDAEKAMLEATGGVNTHRGAIFALGLALNALQRGAEGPLATLSIRKRVSETAKALAGSPLPESHGREAVKKYGVQGAREMALDGYKDILAFSLPYYSGVCRNRFAVQKTLLYLIATLDDTCLIHRTGYERAEALRDEAGEVFGTVAHSADDSATEALLTKLCGRFSALNASPGGAADMLTLTIFLHTITKTTSN